MKKIIITTLLSLFINAPSQLKATTPNADNQETSQSKIRKAVYMADQLKLLYLLKRIQNLEATLQKKLEISAEDFKKLNLSEQQLKTSVEKLTNYAEALKDELEKMPADDFELADLGSRFLASTLYIFRGKITSGFRVVDAEGNELNRWSSFKRFLWKIAGFIFFMYQWVWEGRQGRTWHDKKTGTYVIRMEFIEMKKKPN